MSKEKNIKVKISTGQGRLHLIDSAKYLKLKGVDIGIITGWVPPVWFPKGIINFMGYILGRKNLFFGLSKRRITEIEANKIHSCSLSEFYIQFLFLLSKYKVLKRENAAVKGWKLYGKQASMFIDKNIDVLHVRSGAGQGGFIEKARRLGIKVLVDHSIAHPQEVYTQLLKTSVSEESIEIRPDNVFWKAVISDCIQADAILVNSHYVKDSFVKNGFSADNIFVAELGIRKDFIGLKKNWNIENKKIRLLFTGGFGLRKGANIIVDTVEELIKNNFNFQLDIVGSKMDDFVLPDWFEESPFINFHGHIPQDELKDFLIKSDIYIFPSYSEGAAQSLKEAMAAGLPVITTYQSGAPVIHNVNGVLISDNSSKELFDSILSLSTDFEKRKLFGINASQTISSNHNWSMYAEKVIEVYTYLLKD